MCGCTPRRQTPNCPFAPKDQPRNANPSQPQAQTLPLLYPGHPGTSFRLSLKLTETRRSLLETEVFANAVIKSTPETGGIFHCREIKLTRQQKMLYLDTARRVKQSPQGASSTLNSSFLLQMGGARVQAAPARTSAAGKTRKDQREPVCDAARADEGGRRIWPGQNRSEV